MPNLRDGVYNDIIANFKHVWHCNKYNHLVIILLMSSHLIHMNKPFSHSRASWFEPEAEICKRGN